MKQLKQYLLTLFLSLSFFTSNGQIIEDTLTHFDPKNESHLLIAYELAFQSVRTIRKDLNIKSDISSIKTGYEAILSRLEVYRRIGGENLRGSSLSRLNDLITIFEGQLSKLERWHQTLMETSNDLSMYRIDLVKHKERLTIDQGDFNDIEKQYYEISYEPLLEEADSLNKIVEAKLLETVKLEYDISQDHTHLYNKVQELKSYQEAYWNNVMQKDEVSWEFTGWDDHPIFSGSTNELSNTVWRITDFFKVNFPNALFLLFICLGVVYLLNLIKKEDQKKPNEAERYPGLYKYPIATALLLAGMLFPMVYPPTTSLMYDFAMILVYLPFLYILHANLETKRFRTYVIFFIFLLVLKIQSTFSGTSGIIDLTMIVCGVVFIYTIVPQTLRKHFEIRWKWVTLFNWLLTAILFIGIVSFLFKRGRLGGILINGAGETIALGLILMFFGNWFDQLLDFFSKMNLASDKIRMAEFWTSWKNRIYIVLLIIFLIAFLKNFSLYTPVKDSVLYFFTTERILGQLTFTFGGICLFAIVLYLSSKISSTIKFLTEDKDYYKNKKETANIVVVFRFFMITIGFILALLVSGIPLDSITIILGALSVGIGFGLQNIVGNLISGMILIFERPIQTGDLVELQQHTGFVKDIGIRSSVIRTYDGAEVIVPNSNLVSQEVINWTLSNRQRRVEMRIGVAYGSDVSQVTEVVMKVLKAHKKVQTYPSPDVLLDGFGDNSVDFRCLIWTTDIDNWLRIKSELSKSIYNALNEANITIPFPQRDLHIVSWEVPEVTDKLQNTIKSSLETPENTDDEKPT